MRPLRIALAQVAPRLGELDANVERHLEAIAEARDADASLVVFPELGLTGYLLQDLAAEVAIPLDDPRIARLAAAAPDRSVIVSFVEAAPDHRLFVAAALLEGGELRHVHRKVHLPTYGLFDEGRYFAAGDRIRATPSRLGVPIGIAVCEDFWHPSTAQILALDGAQILVNLSASPGRDVALAHADGLGSAGAWRSIMRTTARLTTSFVVSCNRVGVEESLSFWGGSEVVGPSGAPLLTAPIFEEGFHVVEVDLDDLRRERVALPLLRDERPELVAREYARIVAERAGLPAEGGEAGSRP